MKRAIVVGASSGIGRQVAQLLIQGGWHVGMAARRIDTLNELKKIAPERIYTRKIDINKEEATEQLSELINDLGGLNLYFHAAGIGWQNPALDESRELQTVETNTGGFTRSIGVAFRYFASHAGGHIAAITSVAGTKGLGPAPSYSASKAFQTTYIQALEQLSHSRNLHIRFTEIRPGFVNTPLLFPEEHTQQNTESDESNGIVLHEDTIKKYPLLLSSQYVAKRIVKALYWRRRTVIIDWRWKLITRLWRCIPNCIWKHMRLE